MSILLAFLALGVVINVLFAWILTKNDLNKGYDYTLQDFVVMFGVCSIPYIMVLFSLLQIGKDVVILKGKKHE